MKALRAHIWALATARRNTEDRKTRLAYLFVDLANLMLGAILERHSDCMVLYNVIGGLRCDAVRY